MKRGYFKGATFPVGNKKDEVFLTGASLESNGTYTGHVYYTVNTFTRRRVDFPDHTTLVESLRRANEFALSCAETGHIPLENPLDTKVFLRIANNDVAQSVWYYNSPGV
jgi:hypothetical protein